MHSSRQSQSESHLHIKKPELQDRQTDLCRMKSDISAEFSLTMQASFSLLSHMHVFVFEVKKMKPHMLESNEKMLALLL